MPLLDHFHPPLLRRKGWEGFHSLWAGAIVNQLNTVILPRQYESEPHVHVGTRLEIDVATFDTDATASSVGTITATYAAPAPPITGFVSFADRDIFEIRVTNGEGGWRLVAAIELVSPANKDRPEHRSAFTTKCAAYLQAGVSVVVVDVVTTRTADLHAELCDQLGLGDEFDWSPPDTLSVVAYRPTLAGEEEQLDVWPFGLSLGVELPTVPLWLSADLVVPLELELTYTAACKSLRLA